MNLYVADPEWGWWIILYFYLGGIAAGAYFLGTLVEFWGRDEDRPIARIGYRLAFPLVSVCGVLLIVDLERPERFWHMLLQSEVVEQALDEGWPAGGWGTMLQAPMFKWWSPMSIGAWALLLFGGFSFVSFVASFWSDGRLSRVLGSKHIGAVFHILASAIGFFLASYTGVLVTATNQPIWSDTPWIGPLFLTSAASTGIASVLLFGRWRGGISTESMERLERADLWALGLELFVFLIFLASLGSLLPLALETWPGLVLVAGTLVIGLLLPLGLHVGLLAKGGESRMIVAALLALVGGFLLRFGLVRTAPALLDRFPLGSPPGLDAPLWRSWQGICLLILTLVLAGAIPILLQKTWSLGRNQTRLIWAASLLVGAGAILYALQTAAAQSKFGPLSHISLSPEDQRPRGGGPGASSMNRPGVVHMRSKITEHSGDESK